MSEISCTACNELRDLAPEFVTYGTTENVCSSLAKDNGLANKSSRTDAQDLHIANDCLIGRMGDEINSYDVCDWKAFMKKFISNLYELLKAIICAIGGLWTKIADIEESSGASIDELCDSMDNVMELALHRVKAVKNTKVNDNVNAYGGLQANTVTATLCGKTVVVDLVSLSIGAGDVTNLQVGDLIWTVEKDDVVPSLMHASTWNGIMKYGFMQAICTVANRYTVYAFAMEDENRPGILSIKVHSIVGPTQIATGGIATIQGTPRFFIISS